MGGKRGRCAPSPTDPLRVLWVIKCLGYGGAERLLVDMVAAVDRAQFDYEVAYVLREKDALVPFIESQGTPVHSLGARHDIDVRWMLALRRLLLRGRYDVVHFHLPYTAALGQLVVASLPAARRPGVVYTEHNLWDRAPWASKALIRLSLSKGQQFVTVSQAAQDALPAPLRPRSRMVVHGVDLSHLDPLMADRIAIRAAVRAELGVAEDEVLFITVANLRVQKGYDVLLDAARIIADRKLPVRMVGIGEGPLESLLHARHSDLGLGDRFQFLGQRGDVLRLMAGADAFVLASRYEGLPVVLMEATSVGLPIVATEVGGIPQVLTNELDALIVSPDDPLALTEAISRLALDPELRDRLAGQAKMRSSMFSIAEASRTVGEIQLGVGRAR